jgi:hypothetical protein
MMKSSLRQSSIRPALGLWIALASSFAACGGTTTSAENASAGHDGAGSDPVATSADAGMTGISGRGACDHYFDAQYSRCGGPALPTAETSRIRARFEQVCTNEVGLRGSGITAADLEACATALDVSACQLPWGLPVACDFHGSLAGGAPCADGAQCASGQCQGMQSFTPEGPTMPVTCGTCLPAVAAKQVCAHDTFSAGCGQGAVCITADTTAGDPTYSCVELAQGDVDAACDDLSAMCKPGLYCSTQTGRCTPLEGAGAACGDGPGRGAPGGCKAPLGCGDPPSTCRSGSAGADCVTDQECAPGFGCVPAGPCAGEGQAARIGCSASGQCVAITWAAAGQACSDAVRCLVGSCDFGTGFLSMNQAVDGGLITGTCPEVVADGDPCTVDSTCDTFAQCFRGRCTLLDGASCN